MDVEKLIFESRSLEEQAQVLGGEVHYLWLPSKKNTSLLRHSTSVFSHNNKFFITQRLIHNRNGKLNVNWRDNPSTTVISTLNPENWAQTNERELSLFAATGESLEDARIVNFDGNIGRILGTVWDYRNYVEYGTRSTTNIALIEFDVFGSINNISYPNFGYNGSFENYEKNWTPILGTSYITYSLWPTHKIYDLDGGWARGHFENQGISWNYGDIHCGSQSIQYKNSLVSLFYSSLPIYMRTIQDLPIMNRVYFVGAYISDISPPFKIRAFTSEPIFLASGLNPLVLNSTLVLAPHGLAYSGSSFYISMGVNDAASAVVRIPASNMLDCILREK